MRDFRGGAMDVACGVINCETAVVRVIKLIKTIFLMRVFRKYVIDVLCWDIILDFVQKVIVGQLRVSCRSKMLESTIRF